MSELQRTALDNPHAWVWRHEVTEDGGPVSDFRDLLLSVSRSALACAGLDGVRYTTSRDPAGVVVLDLDRIGESGFLSPEHEACARAMLAPLAALAFRVGFEPGAVPRAFDSQGGEPAWFVSRDGEKDAGGPPVAVAIVGIVAAAGVMAVLGWKAADVVAGIVAREQQAREAVTTTQSLAALARAHHERERAAGRALPYDPAERSQLAELSRRSALLSDALARPPAGGDDWGALAIVGLGVAAAYFLNAS